MAQETDSLVLELLKRLHARFDRFEADLIDVKLRLSSLEKHYAEQASQLALLNVRLDRFDERLGRIERRLDLTDA